MTSENNGMYMPVAPAFGYGGGNGGFGLGDGNGWWLILLILLCGNGLWGGFGGMGGMMWPMMMGGMGAGMGLDYLYPWLNNSEHISGGFRDQQIQSTLTGIQSSVTSGFGDVQNALCNGFGNVQNALCHGFAGTTAAVTGAQNAVTQQLYNNEIANLNRSFAEQSANAQGFNGVSTGIADLKYTVATENCADRTAAAQNTRDIIDSQTRGTQAILDKLCALELDGVKGQLAQAQRENVGLQNQLNMAALRESQTAQNAFISQGFANEVDALYNRLNNCPVPTTPVYGRTPIFTCGGQNMGCGCGGNAFVNG